MLVEAFVCGPVSFYRPRLDAMTPAELVAAHGIVSTYLWQMWPREITPEFMLHDLENLRLLLAAIEATPGFPRRRR